MMAAPKSGGKGFVLEELLREYFSRAGYFVVRGVPYRIDAEDVTDVDLWLYERPVAAMRKRLIVDIKNKRTPKAAERLIWTAGLQSALKVDGSIVATTARSQGLSQLAKSLGIILFDGDAISKINASINPKDKGRFDLETVHATIASIDKRNRSTTWRDNFYNVRSGLLFGLGAQSANKALQAHSFFAEQAVTSNVNSLEAEMAVRLSYYAAAIACISLDFMLSEHAFKSVEERRHIISNGLRYGANEAPIRLAVALVRQYAENGPAVAKQVDTNFAAAAEGIPVEIIADFVSKVSVRDSLYNVARQLEFTAFSEKLVSFDEFESDAKGMIGVICDFNRIPRDKLAMAVHVGVPSKLRKDVPSEKKPTPEGELFSAGDLTK